MTGHSPDPIRYVEPVFRPLSDGNSLILLVIDGCSSPDQARGRQPCA